MDLLSAILAAVVSGQSPKPQPVSSGGAATTLVAQAGGYSSAPGISLWVVNTPYGQFACLQRARNALYGMQATNLQESAVSVRGDVGTTGAAIWCRGDSAILATAGPNGNALGEALKVQF